MRFRPAVWVAALAVPLLVGIGDLLRQADGETWELHRTADAPAALHDGAAAVVGGKLLVFGGFDADFVARKEAYAFDPRSARWDRLSDLPVAFNHANAVFDGEVIWFAGGFVGDHPGTATNDVWKYDVEADQWQPGPPLPVRRAGGGLVLLYGRLHYFGGFDNNQMPSPGLSDHWSLDLADEARWVTQAPMPKARGHFGAVSLAGKAYAIGGATPHGPGRRDYPWVHAYDPSEDRWHEVASLPGPCSHE